MSFGGFGASSSNAQPQPQAQAQGQGQTQSSVPSFSFTGPTPAATPPANTFSFGAPQNQASAGTNNTAPQAGGGLFGQPQQQQQPQSGGGGGLFGSSGGMFGAKPAASSTQPAQGGLFGAASTPTSTNTGAGGMFGQPQQPQQQQQQGGLFGSQSQQPQAQSQSTSTGLFGQQSQGASGSTSLFGSTNQNQNQNQSQSQPGSSLFASQAKPAQGLSFGQSTNTSNTPSGSQGMTKGTKFTDLPEQHQKALEQLDAAFKQQKQMVYGTLDSQEDLGRAIGQVINDVKSAEAECTALEMGLAPLRRACEQLSLKVRSEEEDLQRLAEIWGSYRPTDGRPSSLRAGALRDFRKQYFRKVVAESEERIPRYKKTISELRRAVDSLGNTNDIPSAQAIAHTIQNHQNAIYTLAASVEGLEVRWNDVREYYSQMYKDKTGSIRDPLDIAREKKGLPPVRT